MFLAHVTLPDARAWLAGDLTDAALATRPLPLPGEPVALWVVRVTSPGDFRRVHRLARKSGLPLIFTASHPTIFRLGCARATTGAVVDRFWMDAADAANGGRGRKVRKVRRFWWQFWRVQAPPNVESSATGGAKGAK